MLAYHLKKSLYATALTNNIPIVVRMSSSTMNPPCK